MNGVQVDSFLRDLAQLSAPELRALLIDVFPTASYEGDRTVVYSNEGGHALSLLYRAARKDRPAEGVVHELRRGAALTDDDLAKLRQLLSICRGPQERHVASFFQFSRRRVTRWWRYRDLFQIMPPPQGAPLPDHLLADWPFLLEIRYDAPDNFGIKTRKRMQAMNDLRLLLPVLLIGPTYKPNFERSAKHWVLSSPGVAPELSKNVIQRMLTGLRIRPRSQRPASRFPFPIYAQEYYEVAGRRVATTNLSSVSAADAAPLVDDHNAYYQIRSIGVDDVQEFPAILGRLFDNYYALDEREARQYRRACYWFNLGNFFYGYSGSASFFAHVAAIESLLPKGESSHLCPTCEAAHHPSISNSFREFLETYAPGHSGREKFYSLRSQIAHGSALLQFDIREEWADFHPGRLDEGEQMSALHQTCRVALVNWLLAH